MGWSGDLVSREGAAAGTKMTWEADYLLGRVIGKRRKTA